MEMSFTSHEIHMLEVCDLVDFRKHMDLWNPHSNLISEYFYPSQRKASACLLSLLMPALSTCEPTFCLSRFSLLDV